MELNLSGKTALVTGASIGIGRGIATALAKEGARLAVVARRRNLLEELQQELQAKLVIIEADLLKEDSVAKIAGEALAGLGSVDIVINNAGGSRKFTLDSTEAFQLLVNSSQETNMKLTDVALPLSPDRIARK